MKKSELIRKELLAIAAKNNGLLEPETVVERARPVSSPLHSSFEWDNTEAAHAYRLWQARQLIRVCVEICPMDNKPIDCFVSLTPDRNQGGYRVMTQVLSNKAMREQMLQDALAELQLFQEKYSRLKELANVFTAIKSVRRGTVGHVKERPR